MLIDREVVLDELERQRDAFAEICVNTQAEHIRQQMTGSVMTLDSIAAWVRAQPTPDPSTLVKEARSLAAEYCGPNHTTRCGDMIDRLADALESSETKLARAREGGA